MAVLSRKEKLAYGLGDFGANFVFQSELVFLLFFYTDVFRIPAATAGTVMFIARVVDALSDPVIGAIADRTESRSGKIPAVDSLDGGAVGGCFRPMFHHAAAEPDWQSSLGDCDV